MWISRVGALIGGIFVAALAVIARRGILHLGDEVDCCARGVRNVTATMMLVLVSAVWDPDEASRAAVAGLPAGHGCGGPHRHSRT